MISSHSWTITSKLKSYCQFCCTLSPKPWCQQIVFPRTNYMSYATQSGVVLVSAHVLVGFYVWAQGLSQWRAEKPFCLAEMTVWDQDLLTTIHFPHLSQYFTLHSITMSMPGIGLDAGDTKVSNTDAMPISMGLQFAQHFPIHYPHIKPGRQERR